MVMFLSKKERLIGSNARATTSKGRPAPLATALVRGRTGRRDRRPAPVRTLGPRGAPAVGIRWLRGLDAKTFLATFPAGPVHKGRGAIMAPERVLVVHASDQGSTRDIAEFIGARLRATGL